MYVKGNFFLQLFLSSLWSIFMFIVVVSVVVVDLVSLKKTLQFLQEKKTSCHSKVRREIQFLGNEKKKKENRN